MMISAFFTSVWARAWPYVLMAGSVALVLVGAYSKGRSAGQAAIQAKQQAATIRAQERTINETNAANTERDRIRAIPRERLRDRDTFSRD